MARYELKLPKMGESIAEATITNWLKKVGDEIEEDEAVLEIATDKVDSEVPSEVDGVLKEVLFEVDEVVQVGQVIAIIETEESEKEDDEEDNQTKEEDTHKSQETQKEQPEVAAVQQFIEEGKKTADKTQNYSGSSRFYSPLVKSIAKEEDIPLEELETLQGSGKDGRVTKDDMLSYVEKKQQQPQRVAQTKSSYATAPINVNAEDEVIEMSRMGKLVSKHMTMSKQTSAHVQSFIEVDVTKIWNWRNKVKADFQKREGEKLTFTPIFMEAVAQALKEFPLLNISVDGEKIIKRKHINLGMATALADGNLIVPVIKDADQLNLLGMTKKVNQLADQARNGKLKPDATAGGTYTVTNVGAFGSIMGTPIINQPQVAILAIGAIRKVPAVIETPEGDFIGIRHKMFLSHSYDHRVVNGAQGGMFIKKVKEYLESFDETRGV